MTWFSETWWSDGKQGEAACSSTGRERRSWPSGWAMPVAAVDGERVAQSCCPLHSPRGARMGSATAPFLSIFPVKGWSNFGSKGRKVALSSACARRWGRVGGVSGVGWGGWAIRQLCIFSSQHCIFYLSLCFLLWRGKVGATAWPRHPPAPGRPGSRGWGTPETWGRPGLWWREAGQGPVDRTGCESAGTRMRMWVLGERVRQNKARWCLSAGSGCTRSWIPSLFPDQHAPLHHPGRAGRVPSATVGKRLFYQPGLRDIVLHCFLTHAAGVRGGSSVVGRKQGGKVRSNSQL